MKSQNEDIRKSEEEATRSFFNEVIRFKRKKFDEKIAIIMVSHSVYDLELFLEASEKIGRIFRILFKSSHPNEQIYNKVRQKFPKALEHNITKEKLKDDISTIYELANHAEADEKILIIDIGGYFAPCIPVISKDPYLTHKFIGIVEDTENGHQKYKKYIQQSDIPVFSVARCQQKRTEDYNVGKSIVNTADMLLKNIQMRSEEMTCGVIGFGKIGSSIADHLRQKRVKKLLICDQDPIVLMRAASLDFRIASKADILNKCNMIYCATGQKSLTLKDLEEMEQKDVYIASCTSSDDEFECNVRNFDKQEFNPGQINKVDVSVYTSQRGTKINFLAHGNAINFYLQNNALGNYIRGVQAAILVSALKLVNEEPLNLKNINELNYSEEIVISKIWLKYFNKINYQLADTFLTKGKNKQKFLRETDVQAIEGILETKGYCCVYGENGTGKTEICRKIAQKNENYYELIWYIDKNNEEISYKGIAKKINIMHISKNKEELLHEIFSRLMKEKSFLIIFDNMNDDKQLKNIIDVFKNISTKNKSYFKGIQDNEFRSNLIFIIDKPTSNIEQSRLYELKPLNAEDVRKLLDNSEEWKGEADILYKLSGGYPFLLDKILSYLEHTNLSIQDYASNMQKKLKFLPTSESIHPDQRQEAIIHITLEKIKEWKEKNIMLAYELILFSALLDGECIQPEIFAKFFSITFNTDDKEILRYAKSILEKYGLLEIWQINNKKSYNPYFMRKLSQNILCRVYLNDHTFLAYFFSALRAVSCFFQYNPYKKQTNSENCHEYISHAHVIIQNLTRHQMKDTFYKSFKKEEALEIIDFLYQLASVHLYEFRDYQKSLSFFEKMEDLIKICFKEEDINNDITIQTWNISAVNGKIINLSHIWKEEGKGRIKDLEKLLSDLEKFDVLLSKSDNESLKIDVLINKSYITKYLGHHYLEVENVETGFKFFDKSLSILIEVKEKVASLNKPITDETNTIIRKVLALAHHALGSLYLALDKFKLIYAFKTKQKDNNFLKQAKDELKSAIRLREEILEISHPDLARSWYKYSKILWKLYKTNKKQHATENDKNNLLEALKYSKLAILAQEKNLSAEHVNLQYSKELKRKIKYSLKEDFSIFKKSAFSAWTPGKELTYSPRSSKSNFEPKKALPFTKDKDYEQNPIKETLPTLAFFPQSTQRGNSSLILTISQQGQDIPTDETNNIKSLSSSRD